VRKEAGHHDRLKKQKPRPFAPGAFAPGEHPGQWELSFSNVDVKAKAFWFAVAPKIGAA
jgi:hypothetical protein